MKKFISSALLTLITASFLFSQKPMVAYRKEGIWHFFDTKGKLMWKPYMDVAGQPANWVNGLLRASVMDFEASEAGGVMPVRVQVLYNNKGQIVFRPKVKFRCRIVNGIDAAGFVEVMDYDESRICVFDKAGNLLFRAPNMNGKYIGDGVVAYDPRTSIPEDTEPSIMYNIKDLKTGKELGKVSCSGFDGNLSNGFTYCYDQEFKKSVMSRAGKIVIPMGYEYDDLGEVEIIAQNLAVKGMLIARKDSEKLWSIFDKNGKVLLKDLYSVNEYQHPFVKIYRSDNSGSFEWYDLSKAQPAYVEVMDGIIETPTPKGSFICFELGEDSVTIYDRNSKKIKKLYTPSWDVKVLGEYFWIKEKGSETVRLCYDAQGKMLGKATYDKLGKPKYGVVPFQLDGLWGLMTENGKVLLKPTHKIEAEEGIELFDGFFLITTFVSDIGTFAFYDFNGKPIMSTISETDGWDYIIPAMTEGEYYNDSF